MNIARRNSVALAAALAAGVVLSAAELKPATQQAFDHYVTLTEARMADEVSGSSPFLWIDRQPEGQKRALNDRLRRGEIVSERLETRERNKTVDAPDGLIHHWIGTVLLSGVTLDRVIPFVQDYNLYGERFAPTVQQATIMNHAGDHFDVAMRTWAKKVITVVIDADYAVDYRRLSPTKLYTKSVASNLFEVDSSGKRTPAEQGGGYLWRLNTYCWFESREEGTYEQCESISLTRDVPFGLGWLIKPFITGIPRETLEFTLGRVRRGLQ